MSDIKNMHNELSPRIQQMLAAYGNVPERDPESARRTQARFTAELDGMFLEQKTRPAKIARGSIFSGWSSGLYQIKECLTYSKHSVLLVMTVIMIMSVYLLGGMGITAYAAGSSLPGERLYPIKTTYEAVRANLTMDSAEKARLYLVFAERRLIEMQSLIMKGRYSNIHQAASEYEKDIQKALSAIEHLSQTDRTEALTLNTETANSLRMYRRILTQMLVLIPQDHQSAIQSAISISHSSIGDDDDDDSETAGPTPTPTNTPTPTVPALQPTGVNSTPTPALGNNGDGGAPDRKDDDSKDDDGNGNNAGQGGDEDDDDDGGDEDDDDGGDG